MKKRFFILSVIGMLSLGFAACGSDDEEEQPQKTENNNNNALANATSYVGLMNVTMPDAPTYSNPTAECLCALGTDKMTIVLLNAKFAENMPVALDSVKVEGIAYTKDAEGEVSFSGENIVPILKGVPFAKYTLSSLQGSIKGDSLQFKCNMGEFPLSYVGVEKK